MLNHDPCEDILTFSGRGFLRQRIPPALLMDAKIV
jgi:hypothetical protein